MSKLVGSEGQVISIDPVKECVDLLSKSINENDISNTKVLNYGVGDTNEIEIVYGDLLDPASLVNVFRKLKRLDEVYNLAAQSSPSLSFKQPLHTAEITALGATRLFDSVMEYFPKAKIYQASSSEMYGWVKEIPQSEKTPFNPANPYAACKAYAQTMAEIYKRSYGTFIACGILFNHESPRRGINFVTQKVAYAAACAKLGVKNSKILNEEGEPIVKNHKVAMGNLNAKRDWGFAGDYVKAMWLMLQQKKPDNFVIATGKLHTIEDLCDVAYSHVGLNWKDYVYVDERFIRPTETGPLQGDSSKARKELKWEPTYSFEELIALMVDTQVAKLR
ncbi:GDP-mannose 4,6-dehydratase [Patescibacteria group bacterium]